jgi:hypothetical protein
VGKGAEGGGGKTQCVVDFCSYFRPCLWSGRPGVFQCMHHV